MNATVTISLPPKRAFAPPPVVNARLAWTKDAKPMPEAAAPDWSDCILRIAANGDRAAFAALFRHFAPRVKSYLMKRGGYSRAALLIGFVLGSNLVQNSLVQRGFDRVHQFTWHRSASSLLRTYEEILQPAWLTAARAA